MSHSSLRSEFNVGFIGAGGVNFGGAEGPWDHASRLERIQGICLRGVADPDTDKAKQQLSARSGAMYANTEIFDDYRDMLNTLDLDAVWIGVPPAAHGTMEPGKNIEIECARAGVSIFVEKPLSIAPPEMVREVAEIIDNTDIVCSVGYMFRYSKAVERMKHALDSAPGQPCAFLGTYNCAYSAIRKHSWWDQRLSGGPIVEQATHFVDLARYLLGEPDYSTLEALSIRASEPAGKLMDLPRDEDGRTIEDDIPLEHRVPRTTTAQWRFQNGALGTLTHGVLLHGEKYESQIEVWADGLRLVVDDPYGGCLLHTRRPHSERTETINCADDDPYLTENKMFVRAVQDKNPDLIRSTYRDALRTFELTWAITQAAQPQD